MTIMSRGAEKLNTLDTILLTDFRNHISTALGDTAQFNLLIGENGAGKTNVLEALSLFAPGRGLRRASLPEIASARGNGSFAVSAILQTPSGPVQLGTGVRQSQQGRRIVHINGAAAAVSDLGEWLSVVWLTPAMDRLFCEGASARRRFIDRMVLALEPGHARMTSRLDAALRERRRLLDDGVAEQTWLEAVERQIVDAGVAVSLARQSLILRLNEAIMGLAASPFARPYLEYVPGGPKDRDELAAALQEGRGRDRAAGRSLTGPQRDDIAVYHAGKWHPAAECSTGEQKAMLLTITLAHAGLAGGGRPRLVLLDEVAAHLDPVRRSALFARLRDGGAQVWMTGTELAPFEAISGEAAIWQVHDGVASRV